MPRAQQSWLQPCDDLLNSPPLRARHAGYAQLTTCTRWAFLTPTKPNPVQSTIGYKAQKSAGALKDTGDDKLELPESPKSIFAVVEAPEQVSCCTLPTGDIARS